MIDDARINDILNQTANDFPRAWNKAHHQGDPEAWDWIKLACRRLFDASAGTVRGNWRRGVPGDLSMDGVSVLLEDGQWYFADVIVGAGGPNPQIGYRRPGSEALLRNSNGQYVGEAGTADPRNLSTHFDYSATPPTPTPTPMPTPPTPTPTPPPPAAVDLSTIHAKLDAIMNSLAEVRAEAAEATKAARFAETAATEARMAVASIPKPEPPVYRSQELPLIGTISLRPAEPS